jgi:hypothetical protein
MAWVKPHPLDFVRLRCENPRCDLFYLAHPEEPVFYCFTCQEAKSKKELILHPRPVFSYTPTMFTRPKIYNRYDRPFIEAQFRNAHTY